MVKKTQSIEGKNPTFFLAFAQPDWFLTYADHRQNCHTDRQHSHVQTADSTAIQTDSTAIQTYTALLTTQVCSSRRVPLPAALRWSGECLEVHRRYVGGGKN